MLERTLVYVDTSYLLASFYNSWETGARGQLEIDLREVVHVLDRMITQQLGQPVQRQLWYDGIPESGPHRYQRSLRTIDGVQLRAGQLIEWGDRRTQKAVDTRLVADMVLAGVRGQASDIVLVSGDADMLPGVTEASNSGVRVHLYGFGWDSMSSALRHACDSTTILDPREDFAESMQLNVLEGPLPPIVRDKPLGDCEPPEEQGATEVPDTRVTPPGTARDDESSAGDSAAEDPESTGATPTAKAAAPKVAAAEAAAKAGAREIPAQAEHAAAERAGVGGSSPAPRDPVEAMAAVAAAAAAAKAGEKSSEGADGSAAPEAEAVAGKSATDGGDSAHGDTADATTTTTDAASDDDAGQDGAAGVAKQPEANEAKAETPPKPSSPRPNPSMMAPRRKLRSRYVPLPNEVWASAGFQSPFDVGQQYALWWYESAATDAQRDEAHLLSGGGLPPEIDRPLLQFACETLHEYTLTDAQRVNLRDGFHAGIRGVLLNRRNNPSGDKKG
ncbi:NYN domain-containing protein [Corynebacterium freneyi]|uniref:NYN domain-containing protein n=1 Tax=Corynebacterium freneyi TaxID=134034 RepID=UPI001CCB018F|nr:NYN domain-containing protein [Corynebacterium freneyi]UBI02327.1 NYN domain-containing protein [Corynebacterium freneyi]